VDNVRGYPVYGDYSRPRPTWGVLNAVLDNEVDVAVAWGPLAGCFARQTPASIDIVPITGPVDPALPFAFDISMGVRRGDRALATALDEVIARSGGEIRRILASYGVPLTRSPQALQPSAGARRSETRPRRRATEDDAARRNLPPRPRRDDRG
jgi:mxaJ protein